MRRVVLLVMVVVAALGLAPSDANASVVPTLDFSCKSSPTPDTPGQGLPGFFEPTPSSPPTPADPFAPGATSSPYEQYGFSGLRWNTYDLGCGPAITRDPQAVIGTAVSNWLMDIPVSFAALSAAVTDAAFRPSYLRAFDPMISTTSSALHDKLFLEWIPAMVALLGLFVLIRARGLALASTAGALAWALFVLVLAAALFRWPVAAGHAADQTVTSSLGSVVGGLAGGTDRDPADTVASNVQSSILYRTWLAGELGSTDSPTAKKYGPLLFQAQTLSWAEAHVVESSPTAGQQLIQQKEQAFANVAAAIKSDDPTAYQYLTGQRSETRVGYALLATLATLVSLPFLFVAALMLIASFFIIRLAVMLFPAFATLGVLPAGRGTVIAVGKTVGAAAVNSVIFGIGAAVTITITGGLLNPSLGLPGWLTIVLLFLVSLIMWILLAPFRRLTAMASPHSAFGDAASLGHGARDLRHTLRKVATTLGSAYVGGAAAGAVAAEEMRETPTRAEASAGPDASAQSGGDSEMPALGSSNSPRPTPGRPAEAPNTPGGGSVDGFVPRPSSGGVPPAPTEPEWIDGEQVYSIYRPSAEGSEGD